MTWHPHLWHPTTQVASSPEPLQVRAARGSELELSDGRHLIDAISSWWVTLHGHAEPAIAAAIARQAQQLEQVIFANFSHEPAEQLATRLSALTGLERLFFSDNGSTAVEVALKIAWQWWRNQGSERRQVISFEGAYHGDTFGAMALGERSLFTDPYEPLLFAVARVAWPLGRRRGGAKRTGRPTPTRTGPRDAHRGRDPRTPDPGCQRHAGGATGLPAGRSRAGACRRRPADRR